MKKNSVVGNSFIYSISGILIKCSGLFLTPLYTAHLSTEDYGLTNIASRFIATFSYVVAFSLYSAIPRFYVEKKDSPKELSRFYGTITCFCFLSGIFYSLLMFLFKSFIAKNVFAGVDFFPIVFTAIISLVFTCQHSIYDNILRAEERALKCSLISILYFFCNVGLTIFFVVFEKKGAFGVVFATMISNIVFTAVFLFDMLLSGKMVLCIDRKLLAASLKYSIPIIPHNLSTRIAGLFSTVFLGNAYSLSALGVYSLALQFGTAADAIQTYVNYAYCPWLFNVLEKHEDGYKIRVRKISQLLIEVIGVFLISIALFAPDYFFLFLSDSYKSGWYYVPLIILEYGLKSMYYFYVSVLLYDKQATKYIFIATVLSSILNLFLSAIFIPKMGAVGAVVSDFVGVLLLVLIIYSIYKKADDVGLVLSDFVFHFFIVLFVIMVGVAPIFYFKQTSFSFVVFAYKCLVVLFYVIFCLHRNGIKPSNVAELWRNK